MSQKISHKEHLETLIEGLKGETVTVTFTGTYGASKESFPPYTLNRKVIGIAWGFDEMIDLEPLPGDAERFVFFMGGTSVFFTDILRLVHKGETLFNREE